MRDSNQVLDCAMFRSNNNSLFMLDIKFIRENPKLVQKAAKDKKADVDIAHLLEVDRRKSELHQSVQALQEERNALVKGTTGKPTGEQIEKGKEIKVKLEKVE